MLYCRKATDHLATSPNMPGALDLPAVPTRLPELCKSFVRVALVDSVCFSNKYTAVAWAQCSIPFGFYHWQD